MASSKRKTEIKQAPKNLDKMLFNNYREEGRLQERLRDLSNNSRMRGIELDREKVQVFNELRLNKRRNSSPTIAPVISRPATQRNPTTRTSSRPLTREQTTGGTLGNRRRVSNPNPVNQYLLSEFRRVSQVIPSILSSLNKDDNSGADGEEEEAGGGRRGRGGRRATLSGQGTSLGNLAAPQVRLDPDLKAFAAGKQAGAGSGDDLNIGGIVSTIHSIKTLREDLAGKKRYDLSRAKTSFDDMLKHIHQEERRGSDSDTFTDGACVLLRRKMHKARRASCPAMEFNTTFSGDQTPAHDVSLGSGHPQKSMARSHSTLAAVGRQRTLDADGIRDLLREEDRQVTQVKVANESRRYRDIRTRIGNFLDTHAPTQRRCSLPVLSSHPEVVAENTT